MVRWSWLVGRGSLVVVRWSWSVGRGSLVVVRWSWFIGRGSLALASIGQSISFVDLEPGRFSSLPFARWHLVNFSKPPFSDLKNV